MHICILYIQRATNFRAFLRKMTCKDILWIFATLYQKYLAVVEKILKSRTGSIQRN